MMEEQNANMMRETFPKYPFCDSRLSYEITNVIKKHVQCRLCEAERPSKDFLSFNRISKLRINELPEGTYSYNIKGHLIRHYEEYSLSFWRPLYKTEHLRARVRLGMLTEFLMTFILVFIILLPNFTTHDIGWDEPVYVFAGRAYIIALSERNFLGDVWQWNHEHPPLAKYIYGIFSLCLTPYLGNPYFSARIATLIMSTLTATLVYMFSKKSFGKITGIFSATLLILMPFYYGMSRYVSLDLPVTFFISVYLPLFYLGIEYERATLILLSSVFFGLAGSVKVSGFIGLLILVLWFITIFKHKTFKMLAYYYRKRNNIFLSLIFYPILGIIIFILLWPWLWSHTVDKLIGSDGVLTYAARFKAWGHEEFFEGRIIWHPPPYYYFYYLAVKTPIPALIFLIMGFLQIINPEVRRQSKEALLLVILWFIVPLILQTYQQPYDALRPVLMIFPPMAILSSLGAYHTFRWISWRIHQIKWLNNKYHKEKKISDLPVVTLMVLTVVIPSILAILEVSPYEIAYFNELAGDSDKILSTFESSFWAEGLGGAVDYINKFASYGSIISVIGEMEAFNQFHREDLKIVRYVPPSELKSLNVEYVVFQGFYLQHFVWENRTAWGSPSSALDLWNYLQENGELVHIVMAGKTPLVWIFKVKS